MHAWTNKEKSLNFEIENFCKNNTTQWNDHSQLSENKVWGQRADQWYHAYILTTILDDKSIIIDMWQTNTIRNAVDQTLKISSFCRNLTRFTLNPSFWHVQWFLKHEKQPKWIPGMLGHGGFANRKSSQQMSPWNVQIMDERTTLPCLLNTEEKPGSVEH